MLHHPGSSSFRPTRVAVAICATGLLATVSCNPDEVQAPPGAERIPQVEAEVVPTTGLVGEWKLDETGGTTAADSKNGNNAAVNGGAAFVAGRIGNGLRLDNGTTGTGGKYAQMPSNATHLDNVQEANYSISVWFYPLSIPKDTVMENRFWAVVGKALPVRMGILYNTAGKFLARHILDGGVGEQAATPGTFPINDWYHVVSTVNKTTGKLRLYVDGAVQDSASFTANTPAEEYNATPFQIGKSGTMWAADGQVDQVRIYNRELSSAEVTELFNESGGGGGPTVTTNAATNIKTASATLNGSANPNGAATTGWFRYSTTNPNTCNDSFGTRTPATGGTALGSGTSAVAYSRAISNLIGGRRYYFCAIASNASGTSVGTVRSFMAGGVGLRIGPGGLGLDSTGMGPNDDYTGPKYGYILETTPELNKIHEHIALADQHDVVLMLAPSRGREWYAPNGNFSMSLYKAKVDEFWKNGTDTMFNRAVTQRRILFYVIDEPYHPNFNGTISPAEVNEMAMHHKRRWPGAITFVRVSGDFLTEGWDDANGNNQPPPAGGYTGIDYGWMQYAAFNSDSTFADVYAVDKQKLASVDLGLAVSLNWWAGGIGHLPSNQTLDGVSACWRIDYPAARLGYIVGIDQPAVPGKPGIVEGAEYDCNQMPTEVSRTVANPDWIRRWAEVIAADSTLGFGAIWRHPNDDETVPGAEALGKRADFISALDDAITITAGRTAWTGYRTPKPAQP